MCLAQALVISYAFEASQATVQRRTPSQRKRRKAS
jgi:hypothetical protein